MGGAIARRPGSAPFLHVASFALRADSGEFGAGVTAGMGADAAFAALVEYRVDGSVTPGAGLFGRWSWHPKLRAADFGRDRLQVMRPGHLGSQRFFTRRGPSVLPVCLVISPVRKRPERLAAELSTVLATLRFEGSTGSETCT